MDLASFTEQNVSLPRISITFCTQCRWMLRAAYFAQELLSTFQGAIGEVALVPATGGKFQVHLTYSPEKLESPHRQGAPFEVQTILLWDRKDQGGFPETKILKQRVRDYLDPERDLGHSDKKKHKSQSPAEAKTDPLSGNPNLVSSPVSTPKLRTETNETKNISPAECEDCI